MNLDKILTHKFPQIRSAYTEKDTMLYGLGVGACTDPLDVGQLGFVYEGNLQALPSLSCVLAHPGLWVKLPELEMNWLKLVHAEQRFELFQPLPKAGEVNASHSVVGVLDKGPEKGALMDFVKTLHSPEGELLGKVTSTYLLRGDGGCGNWGELSAPLDVVPDTEPSGCFTQPTLAISALIYRLSGDYNPLHADPEVAKQAGFDKPILQGLCTYGVACLSIVRALCGNNASKLKSMGARFTKPVYPGETIKMEYWLESGGEVKFRCISVERDVVVLDRGRALIV